MILECLHLSITSIEIINTRIYSMTEAEQLQVKRLYITFCNLKKIPESIRLLKNLEILDACCCNLVSVPKWLEELPLHDLALSSNVIKRLPFWYMPHLKRLHLDRNQLVNLPCTIRDYPLDELFLGDNHFQTEIKLYAFYDADEPGVIARILNRMDDAGCLTRPFWNSKSHTSM